MTGRWRALACALLLAPGTALGQAQMSEEPPGRRPEAFGARAETEPASTAEASSTVTRSELEERVPRSAPDALRYEPGVSVQQTAHGQASPYVRGMTGQQVVHVFDGIRLNNGIYRQGPNPYFFTIDSYTLERIEVVRGSASTRYGSDALGGAILAVPRSAQDVLAPESHGRLFGRFGTADLERGGRAEVELALPRSGLLVGMGAREAERLESGGPLHNPGYPAPLVPRFERDGRTQLGTGFEELTFDARATAELAPRLSLVSALYAYRQYDSPRTDQCPPPEAPEDECLIVLEQARTLGYVALRGELGRTLRELDFNLSIQRYDELRVNDRPRSFVRNEYQNGVLTLGASARGATRAIPIGQGASYRVRFGGEAYRDGVDSSAAQELTDPALLATFDPSELRFARSRGQYLEGSIFLQTGAFAELELTPLEPLTLSGGGRVAGVAVSAPGDEASGTVPISERFFAAVGRAGATVRLSELHAVHLNFDQGFRAPNLDDLTSRQQIGPGFQLGNTALTPERTNTLELGVTSDLAWLSIDAWIFGTWIDDSIVRVPRGAEACPPETDSCRASRALLQLENAAGTAWLWGTEGLVAIEPIDGLALRATYSYAWGDQPTPRPDDLGAREPISRVPPLHGTAELRYTNRAHAFYVALATHWALAQRRLALSDRSDARIPIGGTPGYVVQDVRAGCRYTPHLSLNLVFENVLDAAYRVHGSSIHGPGRGLRLGVTLEY